MIGRASELALVVAGLQTDEGVQIVGVPGIGKSTLAQAAVKGRRAAVVPLETVGPDRIGDAIARVLGVPADPAAVRHAVQELDVLVLDGAERVVEALSPIVRELPVTCLVTTRQRMSGPRVVEVGPLDAAAAREIFRERAASVGAAEAVALEPEAVDALVARLAGWPLALELAASRMRVYSPAELLDTPTLPVLTDPSRDPRHASLEAAIEASWNLLDGVDRAALAAMSQFRGPFERDAFREVADAGLASLERLLDASLLQWFAQEGTRRYRVLAPVREFALPQLDDPEAPARYATHVLRLAEDAAARAETSEAAFARAELSRLTPELEGLLEGEPDTAAAAGLALAVLARARGPLEGTVRWLAALDREPLDAPRRQALDLAQADLGIRAFQGAEPLALLAAWPPSPTVIRLRGLATLRTRDVEGAIPLLRQAVELADADPSAGYEQAYARHSLGVALLQHGEAGAAAQALREARERVRRIDAPDLEGLVLKFLAQTERDLGAPVEQRNADAARAVELHEKTGNLRLQAMALNVLAMTQLDARSPDADVVMARGDQVARRAGMRTTVHQMVLLRGLDRLGNRDIVGARDAIDALAAMDIHPYMVSWVEALRAVLLVHQGEVEAACRSIDAAIEGARQQSLSGDAVLFQAVAAMMGHGLAPEPLESLPADAPARLLCELSAEVASGSSPAPALLERADGFAEVRAFASVTAAGVGTEVALDGSWFRTREGERVDIRRRRVLRRVLGVLAAERGAPISQEALLARGWPGETPTAASGKARVHVAIADLRKLGLREALETVLVDGRSAYRLLATVRGRP